MGDIADIPSPGVALTFGVPGRPAAVVVPDAYGRLPWLEPFATALADRARLRVLVPDLYQGAATDDVEQAERLLAEFSLESALGEVQAAVADARTEGSERIGLVGFGTGGRIALLAAQDGAADAVVAYDAILGVDEHAILPAPVLLQLAEIAEWLPGVDPEGFVDRLRDHGTPVVRHDYAGARPGFANATAGDSFDARIAALAFARTAVFLEDRLHD
ncbi:dienelactone hydrolase family protein [Pseudolysinimonas sp.]|uniref:dienelactone hydrolase family protein n=1 Tax=Pseudolysinimonas sp. TaxID=2680009 RepID=UPI003F7F7A91